MRLFNNSFPFSRRRKTSRGNISREKFSRSLLIYFPSFSFYMKKITLDRNHFIKQTKLYYITIFVTFLIRSPKTLREFPRFLLKKSNSVPLMVYLFNFCLIFRNVSRVFPLNGELLILKNMVKRAIMILLRRKLSKRKPSLNVLKNIKKQLIKRKWKLLKY